MIKAAAPVVLAALLIGAVMLARTPSYRPAADPPPPSSRTELPAGADDRLAGAIRLATISHEDPAAFDGEAFRALHAHLATHFPRVHSALRRETVASHSLLYTWQGRDAALRPILLSAHLDVVPVERVTEDEWHQPPFSGRIADGFVWGRGAIDNKSAVMGTLEAVEMLLEEGFRPARTVYLAYGHDEEVGGIQGARAIAALLAERGVRLEMVLDEGGVIGDGVVPNVAPLVALVGIAEKGFVSLELSAEAAGGHSSLPPEETAIGIVSAAVTRLEQRQMAPRLEGATRELIDRIGPHLPFIPRVAVANLWLTKPVVLRELERVPSTNAMIRTTTAVTMFQAGTKDNVLPSRAAAVVNFRILPGDSVATVVEHVREAVDDSRIGIEVVGAFTAEPSDLSSSASASYRALERAVGTVAPDVIVAPYQVVVTTDSRHYARISHETFRFLPVQLTPLDLERIHGTNERLAVRDYARAIRLYRELIVNAAGG